MNLDMLDDHIASLDDVIDTLRPSRVRQLEWLRDDLHVHTRHSLTTALHRRAWDRIVFDRLDAINVPTRVKPVIDRIKLSLRSASSGTSLKIHFGQQRVAGTFQVANVNQQQLLGFPADLAQNLLVTVAARLQNAEYLADQIPVQIFWHPQSNKWIAANNRGYTVHCMASVRPLRLFPTVFSPQDIEMTRLQEVEGQGGVGPWTGVRGGEPNPRTLPSTRMFITPAGNAIAQVVQVPLHWG